MHDYEKLRYYLMAMIDLIAYKSQIKLQPSTLILGAFDAIHNGHLKLISEAKKFNLPIVITIFDDTTKIPSKKTTWQYSTLNVKLTQLATLGISKVVLINFDEVRNLSGIEFIDYIKRLTNAQHIVAGHNFGYGKNRMNNHHDLVKQFANTTIVSEYKFNNQNVSTSLLKQLVVLGEVDIINDLSPFPYTIVATIKKTDVVELEHKTFLHPSIYGVFVEINHIRYYGLYHHGLKTQTIIIPDFVFQVQKYEAKIMIICNIRHIINDRDDLIKADDLLLTKNKLTTYIKNHI